MFFKNFKIPKLIHRTSSPYNELIEVYQVGDERRLGVNGIVQSISWTESSVDRRFWGRIADFVFKKRAAAKNILLLGLGGGTMLHLFNRDMPSARVTAIEIDSEMIKIAEEFFDLDSLKNHTIINADVMRVITDPKKHDLHKGVFDVVIVDIFSGREFPQLGSSGTFFSGLKWFLRPEGLLVVNRIYTDEARIDVDDFVEGLKKFFVNVGSQPVAGRTNSDNLLIYGETTL